jgi:hypothetical protein
VAIGVNREGYREILVICEGAKEDKAGWSSFLKHQGTRSCRRAVDHFGCRERRRVLSRGALATLHRGVVEKVAVYSAISP